MSYFYRYHEMGYSVISLTCPWLVFNSSQNATGNSRTIFGSELPTQKFKSKLLKKINNTRILCTFSQLHPNLSCLCPSSTRAMP